MAKEFNTTAVCIPKLHYMVNLQSRLEEIKKMVDAGKYFTINRARQYGKTTTLRALEEFLKDDYIVVSLDFQMLNASKFKNENIFSIAFAKMFLEAIQGLEVELQKSVSVLKDAIKIEKEEIELFELFQYLSKICASCLKPIVLMIDEVDSATNNQVFLDFLAQLRGYYIKRDRVSTFQSVILAGVSVIGSGIVVSIFNSVLNALVNEIFGYSEFGWCLISIICTVIRLAVAVGLSIPAHINKTI